MLDALKMISFSVTAMERMATNGRLWQGVVVVSVWALVGRVDYLTFALGGSREFGWRWIFFSSLADNFGESLSPDFPLDTQAILAVAAFLTASLSFGWWILVASTMYLITRFFGGSGRFRGILAVVGVACLPLIFFEVAEIVASFSPEFVEPVVGWILAALFFAVWAWHITLVIVGGRFARRIDYAKSSGSCGISCPAMLALLASLVAAAFALLSFIGAE